MTTAEATALLTAEQQESLDAFAAAAPPLSEAQKTLLTALLADRTADAA